MSSKKKKSADPATKAALYNLPNTPPDSSPRTISPDDMLLELTRHRHNAQQHQLSLLLEKATQLLASDSDISASGCTPSTIEKTLQQTGVAIPEQPTSNPLINMESIDLDAIAPNHLEDILSNQPAEKNLVTAPHKVSLTVNNKGYLVLNWTNPTQYNKWDYIALFDAPLSEPNISAKSYLSSQWQYASKAQTGSYTTGTKRNIMRSYWVAYCMYDYSISQYIIYAQSELKYSGDLSLSVIDEKNTLEVMWTNGAVTNNYDWVAIYDDTVGLSQTNYAKYGWVKNGNHIWETGYLYGGSLNYRAIYWVYSYSLKQYIPMGDSNILPSFKRNCDLLSYYHPYYDTHLAMVDFRYLISWSHENLVGYYDWVGLWEKEPTDATGYGQWTWTKDNKVGYFKTTTKIDPNKSYWMAYCTYSFTDKKYKVIWKAPFIQYPDWMTQLGAKIKNKKLRDLTLPGTHDSATYKINANSTYSPDSPITKSAAKPIVAAWAKTQEFNITQQLNAGYRYFDLRISNWGGVFWLYHAMYSVQLDEVLAEIKNFTTQHPNEIILLNLSHFQNMSSADHTLLIEKLKYTFGSKLAQNSIGVNGTVEQFWSAKSPIVIIYDYYIYDPVIWNQNSSLASPYSEDNFHTAKDVINWLKTNVIPRNFSTLWVLQLVITPDWKQIAKGIVAPNYDGLGSVTSQDAVWPFVNFVRGQTRKLNIVMVDFMSFYPIVSWAIEQNSNP